MNLLAVQFKGMRPEANFFQVQSELVLFTVLCECKIQNGPRLSHMTVC